MPRQRRLNIPGAIYHVIARGINRSTIFRQKRDRIDFLERLSKALETTNSRCYAWALMENHVHLLIRLSNAPLADLMRKILTGYAINFNLKYNRSGYLFQNRYKSILCQEDIYFLELVRYIHLNPVRSGKIETIEELNNCTWTGHSVLLGNQKQCWQSTDEVLLNFNQQRTKARKSYVDFIQSAWDMGKREDLMGGGLRRSAGGWQELIDMKQEKTYWRGDERLLGDDDFVSQVFKVADEQEKRSAALKKQGWNLEKLTDYVCQIVETEKEMIRSKCRQKSKSDAIALIAYWGVEDLDMKGSEIAEYLNVSSAAITKAVSRGRRFVAEIGCRLKS